MKELMQTHRHALGDMVFFWGVRIKQEGVTDS